MNGNVSINKVFWRRNRESFDGRKGDTLPDLNVRPTIETIE